MCTLVCFIFLIGQSGQSNIETFLFLFECLFVFCFVCVFVCVYNNRVVQDYTKSVFYKVHDFL